MQKQRIARSLVLALFVGLALALVASATTSTTPSGTTVQTSFINVGQGDSVFCEAVAHV